MGYYSLLFLFLGILSIGIVYTKTNTGSLRNNLIFLLVFIAFLVSFFSIHHHYQKTCEILISSDVSQALGLIRSWGIASPLLSILLMTMQAVIAPLPALLITAANGILFGVFWGTVISLMGAMGGAMVSFSISRWIYNHYAKDLIQGKKAEKYIEEMSGKHGFKIILVARLIPFISFDLISYVAGLSNIKIRSFALATLIGMFPATVVYTMLGQRISELEKYTTGFFVYSTGAALILIVLWVMQSLASKRRQKKKR